MDRIYKRPEFVDYQEALDTFTEWRKELNTCIETQPQSFQSMFDAVKFMALSENAIAMDVLAYYYKTGVPNLLPEDYMKYIKWELIAAARGNQLAIEKVQFLIGYACDASIESEDYEVIKYKNDIDDYNVLYVLGKALAKILVRDYLKAFPVDLYNENDDYRPYKQEDFVNLRKMIDSAIPKTIEFLKS